jgi:hypothetical protein
MNRNSKYYAPENPEWTCVSCGEMFQLKTGHECKCTACMKSERDKMKPVILKNREA